MKTKLKIFCVFLVAAVFFLSSCSSTQSATAKTGAAVGLPFAFVGDSVLFPFQCLGHISAGLLNTGSAYDMRFAEQWSFTEDPNEGFGFVFSIPGYILSPFLPLAQFKFFALTDTCVATLTRKNIPYRRRRKYYY